MDILDKIDKLRIAKGWSVYKLAEESMITQSTLANMFTRKTLPSLTTLTSLCNGLGISLSRFFAEDDNDFKSLEEQQLIQSFNALDEKGKAAVMQLIDNLK